MDSDLFNGVPFELDKQVEFLVDHSQINPTSMRGDYHHVYEQAIQNVALAIHTNQLEYEEFRQRVNDNPQIMESINSKLEI